MAAIRCPECNKMASDKGKNCPYCGSKLPRENGTLNSLFRIFVGIFTGVILIFVFCIVFIKPVQEDAISDTVSQKPVKKRNISKSSAKKRDWREIERPGWAYSTLSTYLERHLKSPKSADFPGFFDIKRSHVRYLGDQKYLINSYVDAQNSFGAEIRTHFSGEVEQIEEDKWIVLSFRFLE